MKEYLKKEEWKIVERGFHPDRNPETEKLFCIGNGFLWQSGSFAEYFSGASQSAAFVAGQPAPHWIGLDVKVDGEVLDLNHAELYDFERTLHLKEGFLERSFEATLVSGKKLKIKSRRFCSMADPTIGVLGYEIEVLNFSGKISITSYVDGENKDENIHYPWQEKTQDLQHRLGYLTLESPELQRELSTAMQFQILKNGVEVEGQTQINKKEKYIGSAVDFEAEDGDKILVYKYVAHLLTSVNTPEDSSRTALETVSHAAQKGFAALLEEHQNAWATKWQESDVIIEGDEAAQHQIRYHIFQLHQQHNRSAAKMIPSGTSNLALSQNIHSWEFEIYHLPFYLMAAGPELGRSLLISRYHQLGAAIDTAKEKGFKDGAALFLPGKTTQTNMPLGFPAIDQQIHVNGAIAYGIYDYVRCTGDRQFLAEYGFEILLAIARFWAQRIHYSEHRQQYLLHGVVGPNAYEFNANNNWYTSKMALWCLEYAIEAIDYVQKNHPERYSQLEEQLKFYEYTERNQWLKILDNMYLPESKDLGIILQQDDYLDKRQLLAKDTSKEQGGLSPKGEIEKIWRSNLIQQADVLLGLHLFSDQFDKDAIRRNFEFYEARTLHDAPVSPGLHAILAARLGMHKKAYDLYSLGASREFTKNIPGLSVPCRLPAGASQWMVIVKGFAGMRVTEDMLYFDPVIPRQWQAYTFKVRFRNHLLKLRIREGNTEITNQTDQPTRINLKGKIEELPANGTRSFT